MFNFSQLNASKKKINLVLWLLVTLPFLYLIYGYYFTNLTNPFDFIVTHSGQWAMYFFLLSYSVSPICRLGSGFATKRRWSKGKRLSDWNFIIFQRRMLGLNSFYYAALHFIIYFYYEIEFSFAELWLELTERHFLIIGALGLIILFILAITSLQYFQKLLKRNWKYLHQLVNPAAILIIVHLIMVRKTFSIDTLIYLAIFILLSAERLVYFYQYLRDKRRSELVRLARTAEN